MPGLCSLYYFFGFVFYFSLYKIYRQMQKIFLHVQGFQTRVQKISMGQREGRERKRESTWERRGADSASHLKIPRNSQTPWSVNPLWPWLRVLLWRGMFYMPICMWSCCNHMVGEQPELRGQYKGPGEKTGGETCASAPWVYKAGWERRSCSGEISANAIAGPSTGELLTN